MSQNFLAREIKSFKSTVLVLSPFQLWCSCHLFLKLLCFFKVLSIFDNFESHLFIFEFIDDLCVNYIEFKIFFYLLAIYQLFYVLNLFSILTFQLNLFLFYILQFFGEDRTYIYAFKSSLIQTLLCFTLLYVYFSFHTDYLPQSRACAIWEFFVVLNRSHHFLFKKVKI